ncbi:MAG: chloride channel protein, partial [Desulfobulbaceae bacterium]|nr:chloride channel protein [Desulfobulbaceae bacterium]
PPSYFMAAPASIFLYLILGLVSALVAVGFIRMLNWFEIKFETLRFPQMFKPAVGALLLGILGFSFMYTQQMGTPWSTPSAGSVHEASVIENIPSMYGSGFPIIEQALQGRIDFWFLLLLVLLKPLATCFTLGSGNSGGVFAPSLFIGAMLGGGLGQVFVSLFPTIAGSSGAYALVGMAAVFAAAARAPLTSMLIVFEMTNDYSMILPLMAAAVTASSFAQYLYGESIYTSKLARRGIRFVQGRDLDVMQGVSVEEVMNRSPITVGMDLSLDELETMFTSTRFLGFPVLDEQGKLVGIVTLQDIQKVLTHRDRKQLGSMCVADIAITEVITVYPDEPIWTAIQKMAPRDLARLPVVGRGKNNVFYGIISRSEILRAYEVAIVKKQRGLMPEKTISLRGKGDAIFYECHIKSGSKVAGMRLRLIGLPDKVNVVSIARNEETVIPMGDTNFEVGDVVTFYSTKKYMDQVRVLLSKQT